MSWPECCSEVDWCRAVMTECEADLAIVVSLSGSLVAGCRGGGREGGRVPRRDRQGVTVLGEEHRLEKDCKNAEQRHAAPPSRQPRLVRPERCR